MAIGEAFLSAFLQALFDRLALKNFRDVIQVGNNGRVLKKLKKTLLLIKRVINDAENKQVKNEAVSMWLNELKDVAYDAEDVLDGFATEVLRKKLESITQTNSIRVWNLVSASLNPKAFLFKADIESKIKDITERFDNLVSERQELGLSEVAAGSSCKGRETSSLVDESHIFGRDMDKEKIIKLLMANISSCGNEVSIIPIVGMAGVGKTVLAQVLFNDVRVDESFDLKVWVSVSDDFDVKIITRNILESATSRSCDFNSLDQLQFNLKTALCGKKFLIVLDDVWNKNYNDWIHMETPFKEGAWGSSMIMTTRSAEATKMIGTVDSHFLACLSDDECWPVFMQHAFKDKSSFASLTLLEIGRRIAEKCRGLPLVATTLGGILSKKQDENEWEND